MYLVRRLKVWTLRRLVTAEPRPRIPCKHKTRGKVEEIVECYEQSRNRIAATRTELT
jgi:hypothetical protein